MRGTLNSTDQPSEVYTYLSNPSQPNQVPSDPGYAPGNSPSSFTDQWNSLPGVEQSLSNPGSIPYLDGSQQFGASTTDLQPTSSSSDWWSAQQNFQNQTGDYQLTPGTFDNTGGQNGSLPGTGTLPQYAQPSGTGFGGYNFGGGYSGGTNFAGGYSGGTNFAGGYSGGTNFASTYSGGNNYANSYYSAGTNYASYGGTSGSGFSPVVLDLTGDGINITQLTSSNQFFDMAGSGQQNQTAWAGVNNGVLFFDPTGAGQLTQANQIVFKDWDPSASSDMQALLDVFDTNHDGALDAGDANFSNFFVMVTNADGTQTAGESGTVGALAAVMSAVNDALHHIGAPAVQMPATSETIWRAIEAAKQPGTL